MPPEQVVHRQQHQRHQEQHRRRKKGHPAHPPEQVKGRRQAIEQPRQVFAVVDLHGLHTVHGGGDGGHGADLFNIAHVQLQRFGENGPPQGKPGFSGAVVLRLAGEELRPQKQQGRQQRRRDGLSRSGRRHLGADQISQKPGDNLGKGRRAHQRQQLERCDEKNPPPQALGHPQEGFVEQEHDFASFHNLGFPRWEAAS